MKARRLLDSLSKEKPADLGRPAGGISGRGTLYQIRTTTLDKIG